MNNQDKSLENNIFDVALFFLKHGPLKKNRLNDYLYLSQVYCCYFYEENLFLENAIATQNGPIFQELNVFNQKLYINSFDVNNFTNNKENFNRNELTVLNFVLSVFKLKSDKTVNNFAVNDNAFLYVAEQLHKKTTQEKEVTLKIIKNSFC